MGLWVLVIKDWKTCWFGDFILVLFNLSFLVFHYILVRTILYFYYFSTDVHYILLIFHVSCDYYMNICIVRSSKCLKLSLGLDLQ